MKMSKWLGVLFLLLASAVMRAQQPGKLSFEVASIKPSAPQPMGRMRMSMNADGAMLRYSNIPLRDILRVAFDVKTFQIEGPDWLESERFDINAKLPDGATKEQIPEMLQSLLADRFKLAVHRDTKEHAIYALTVAKGGPKLAPPETQTAFMEGPMGERAGAMKEPPPGATKPGAEGGPPRGAMMIAIDQSGMHLRAPSASLANIAEAISRFTERPVVDMTGIQGQYSFDLVFAPETMGGLPRRLGPPPGKGMEGREPGPAADAPAEPAASIFEAVQKYGLKLEPRKAPLEMVIVDHIEKTPTED